MGIVRVVPSTQYMTLILRRVFALEVTISICMGIVWRVGFPFWTAHRGSTCMRWMVAYPVRMVVHSVIGRDARDAPQSIFSP